MANSPTHQKYPEDSANRDYDLFEELPDGSTVWRASVFGMSNTEIKLRELARESNNRFFALNLHDRSEPIIRPWKSRATKSLERASSRSKYAGPPQKEGTFSYIARTKLLRSESALVYRRGPCARSAKYSE